MGGVQLDWKSLVACNYALCIDPSSIIIEGLFILPVFYSLIDELCSCFRAVDLEMETLSHL
jgi:hypothetical protein